MAAIFHPQNGASFSNVHSHRSVMMMTVMIKIVVTENEGWG